MARIEPFFALKPSIIIRDDLKFDPVKFVLDHDKSYDFEKLQYVSPPEFNKLILDDD